MINKYIKELRKELKLNQADFAKAIGIKQSTLSVIESGGGVTEHVITTICVVYNVNRTWLETGTGQIFAVSQTGGPSREALMIAQGLEHYKVTGRPIHEVEEIREMLNALLEILTSENETVKYAIKSNLVAFQHTVRSDNKIISQDNNIRRLRAEINELKNSLKNPTSSRPGGSDTESDFKTQGTPRERKHPKDTHRAGGK
ncbi:MAG: helix-turn-helix domain-containing protein [Chloroflexi bacterium]|nr:helix-turn-helix domain-containing protein [Chloroflexota bacterium]